MFFNYLVDAGLLPNNPAERLKPRRPQSRPVQPFTQQELMGMLTACKTPQDRAIFLLLLGGGLRRDEVFQITRAHVNFEDGTITVLGKGARYTRSRLPVELVWARKVADRSRALSLEASLKRLSRTEKLQWVRQGRREVIDRLNSKLPALLKSPAAR